ELVGARVLEPALRPEAIEELRRPVAPLEAEAILTLVYVEAARAARVLRQVVHRVPVEAVGARLEREHELPKLSPLLVAPRREAALGAPHLCLVAELGQHAADARDGLLPVGEARLAQLRQDVERDGVEAPQHLELRELAQERGIDRAQPAEHRLLAALARPARRAADRRRE